MTAQRFKSFAEFWPFYVKEHSRPATRALHAVGTVAAIACLIICIATRNWFLIPLTLIPGYAAAWTAHFFIEKNRPATFTYPLWSFIGDYKMIGMMLIGRMGEEVKRALKD
ncbi:MAG: DUF962 domain-containing protein [Acidobacteriota bacterium]|nr:DUF962 domain-containing protein [Acidobacteriota bacterium]